MEQEDDNNSQHLAISKEDIASEADQLYSDHLQNINEKLKKALNVSQAMSCRWRGNSVSFPPQEEDCNYHRKVSTEGTRIALFNPMEFERTLCDGTRIGPASILVLKDGEDLQCSEPPRLFPSIPSVYAKDKMPPTELKFRTVTRGNLPDFPCDVPCRSDEGMGNVAKRTVEGTPFLIVHSMEGAQYYSNLRVNPNAHRHHQYYSTTSFESEIPLPYFSFEEYGTKIQGPAVNYSEAIKGAVFVARNCNSRNDREGLVKSLIDSDFRVDSVSRCLNNADPPEGAVAKRDIMRHYLFHLAFENQCENDYITEKLWETLQSGTVPVYYGAPNADQHVPPGSIINANDFKTSEALSQYLNKVANNKTLYETYHAWRTQPLPESFLGRYNFTHSHSTCRTCRWAAAKKYGLGWNSTTQTIEDLRITRKVCHDAQGILTHPFREAWLSSGNNGKHSLLIEAEKEYTQNCETQVTQFTAFLKIGHHSIRRTVYSQDGITDIHLEGSQGSLPKSDSLILQMSTTIDATVTSQSKSLKALSVRHYRFQDAMKRMTILSSRDIEAQITGNGVLEIHIPHLNVATALRIIAEDIEQYPDSKKRSNYFGQLMTEDFLNPLEKFVVWGNPMNESDWAGRHINSLGLISQAEEDNEEEKDVLDNEEEEEREAIRVEAEAIRKSLIRVKDEKKTAAEKRALDGIKKLIDSGVIKIIDP